MFESECRGLQMLPHSLNVAYSDGDSQILWESRARNAYVEWPEAFVHPNRYVQEAGWRELPHAHVCPVDLILPVTPTEL